MRARMPRSAVQLRVSTVQTSFARSLERTSACHFGCVTQMISAFAKDSRKAATAGKVCTISPSEPSRMTRNFWSAMGRLTHAMQELTRRMVLGVAHDRYANSQTVGGRSLRHALGRVVGSFCMYVRSQFLEQRFDIRLWKDHDKVDRTQRGYQQGPRALIENRPSRPFQPANAAIRVDAHDQGIAFRTRALQIANMANVQDVEASVGKHDLSTLGAQVSCQLRQATALDDLVVSGLHVTERCRKLLRESPPAALLSSQRPCPASSRPARLRYSRCARRQRASRRMPAPTCMRRGPCRRRRSRPPPGRCRAPECGSRS